MAYPKGTDDEFQRKFFDIYQPTLRNTVCWAAMGNDEGYTSKGTSGIGPYYDAYVCPKRAEAGGLPSTTEAFYSFDYANVHFICLDSHDLDRSPAGVMAQWLRADLERTKAAWIVAFFHHPPYTKGSHDSDKEGSLIEDARARSRRFSKPAASTWCSPATRTFTNGQCSSTVRTTRRPLRKAWSSTTATAAPKGKALIARAPASIRTKEPCKL